MEKIKVKLRKYTYTLIREPAPTDKIAGCFGVSFVKEEMETTFRHVDLIN